MIEVGTRCVITQVPDRAGIFGSMLGANVTASGTKGLRDTGTQQFKLDTGGVIFGNADSGFVVEAKG